MPDLLERQPVGIEFLLVDIDVYIPIRRTGEGDVAYTIDLVELRDNLVVEDLVESGVGLISRDRILRHRHGTCGEFEDHRRAAVVRQVVLGHIDERTNVVHRLVHVTTPLQLQHNHRQVVFRLRSDMLEVIDGCQGVLHDLRHVRLHFRG